MHRIPIINVGIDTTSYADSCDRIVRLSHQNQSGYVIAANVHVVMMAYWDRQYRQVLEKGEIVTPDGMPLVWALRLLGTKKQQRVYGPDLMLALCDRAVLEDLSIYLFGATDDTLGKLERNLKLRFPNLAIAGKHAPPYLELNSPDFALQLETDIRLIKNSGAKIVFVALGCPKQEFWMHVAQYKSQYKLAVVMIGVGAAFDFHSGQVAQAPRWMMAMGLEWLYRFCQEPKRLWQRYLINNPMFVILFAIQYLRRTLFKM
ncbi:WecB/TagA/CpsF family glycosyltransferase [Pseudanabaena sp. FACHB-1998]|uniref:WecB/TagA/CpsF family glycosyltransferase n=1 Tax=Pseudanabaena sp. FACHB-1998 TaxID=2692858 RepID=UPI0016811A2C|nr:WecB/TagA/CpsF family glycosyltransferase [Pseudanabaena sp. FACHB-1998]MBD2176203.1 WecB/TagA/CpsF family glycosyltransferase [Pseudanabaena sp. FACHB-1998]